jgi:hypothetical protein
MSAIANQPTNKNFLSPFGFKFSIKKTPSTNWFVQSVNVPDVSFAQVDINNPFVKIPVTGDHLNYGDLTISFRVDEDMKNYLELYNWLQGIGFPDTFDQYKNMAPSNRRFLPGNSDPLTGNAIYSDASLIILSSAMNPIMEVTFLDAFPIRLSELSFDSKLTDVLYIEASATFKYRKFNIKSI